MVLLKAVCDAKTTNSAITAMLSRMMTCFRSDRLGGRVETGAFTPIERRSLRPLTAHYRCREAAKVASDESISGFGETWNSAHRVWPGKQVLDYIHDRKEEPLPGYHANAFRSTNTYR